ncbi:MAG: hypothetical protein J6R59_10805 [Paludibacteraceae bacterium]|nr:hypothetical protein [Paludibacteraceae bacterium]
MARTSTKTAVENIIDVDTVEEMNEEITKTTKETIKVKPLEDSDEIEVVSLVPNVSYKDSKTLDMYEWREAGHSEYMTFDTLKNLWRNNKGYFKNLWLKPMDDRVINKFGLTKTFEKYEYLMDGSNYTKKNIQTICDAIKGTPNGLKFSICNKVKNLVIGGEITNVFVIRELEKHLQIDLIDFLD